MPMRRSSATVFGPARGWASRAYAAVTRGAAPATIPRPSGFPRPLRGRGPGAMDAGARVDERAAKKWKPVFREKSARKSNEASLASAAPGLYGQALLLTQP